MKDIDREILLDNFGINYRYTNNRYLYKDDEYDSLISVIVEGMFGFCGCGQPWNFLNNIKDTLELLNEKHNSEVETWEQYYKKRTTKETQIFGNSGAALAGLGGVVHYLTTLKTGRKFKLSSFFIELICSAFVGVS